MSQSTVLIATLAAAFVLFIAARGRLGAYGAVFFGKPPSSGSGSGGSGSSAGGTLATVATIGKTVAEVAPYLAGL